MLFCPLGGNPAQHDWRRSLERRGLIKLDRPRLDLHLLLPYASAVKMVSGHLSLLFAIFLCVWRVSSVVIGGEDPPSLANSGDDFCASDEVYDWSSADPSKLAALVFQNNLTGACLGKQLPLHGSAGGPPSLVQRDRSPRGDATQTISLDTRPTPAPTGDPSPGTTVHIKDKRDFALLMPGRQGGEFYLYPSIHPQSLI